jgi:hypothetical protein
LTLIITAGNTQHYVQVSDRRLTVNGSLAEDEANKAVVLHCGDARLALGFTGLARVGGFKTREWLLRAINESGPPHYTAISVIKAFEERATRDFRELPSLRTLPDETKRLTVLFSGYHYGCDPPLGVAAIVTNFETVSAKRVSPNAWAHFDTYWTQENRPIAGEEYVFLKAVGALPPLVDYTREANKIKTLLSERRPVDAIVGTIVSFIRKVAKSSASKGLIGNQLTSIVVPRERALDVHSEYHTEEERNITYIPDQVYVVSSKLHLTVTNITVNPVDGSSIVGPKLKPKQRCWCSSGKRYRNCHGLKEGLIPLRIIAAPDDS